MNLRILTLLFVLVIPVFTYGQKSEDLAPFRFGKVILHDPAKIAFSFEDDKAQYFFVKTAKDAENDLLKLSNAFYLGERTYIVKTRPSQLEWWTQDGLLQAWAHYPNNMKVHPDLREENEVPVLEVVLNKNFSHEQISKIFHDNRIPVEKRLAGSNFAVVKNEQGVIERLKGLDAVLFVHPGGRKSEPEDLRAKRLHRSDLLEGPGMDDLGFDGEGVSVLVRDDGMVGPHLDFKGRLFNDPGLPFETNRTHGDGVAGIIGAAGNVETQGRGMAPGANIYATRYESSFMDNTLQLHIEEDVLYTNSSYSNGCNDGYTPNAAEVDRQIYEYPALLHIFSAGNDGNSDCGYGAGSRWGNITGGHKQSKNSIATANVSPLGEIMSSSSRGPATDGRLKPDIAANGNNNYSTAPNNNYAPFSGTSGAAPCVAGVAAQLCEAYKSIYQETPSSALIKAVMLNAADDTGEPGPDFIYGWGLLDAFGAYTILEKGQFFSGEISENENILLPIDLPDTAERVKIMLYWADAPGLPMATKALVNDLDLSAEYNGDQYLPLVLDPSPNQFTLDDPAKPGIDTLNNMEQIIIDDVSGGTVTLDISGSQVPVGPQSFYVVYEVLQPEADFQWISPRPGEIYNPANAIQLQWINNITNENSKTILYSKDGGTTWQETSTFSTNDFYTLRLDSIKSGDSLLVGLIEGAYSDTLEGVIYFAEKHAKDEIFVDQVCPRDASISWRAKEGATSYLVYILGSKYMEFYQETTDTFMTVPLQNPLKGQIYSVSARYQNVVADRSDGRVYVGELLNCPQLIELGADTIEVTNPTELYYCSPFDLQVRTRISNMGIEDVDSFQLCYSLNGGDTSCQWFDFIFSSGTDTMLVLDSTLRVDTTRNMLEFWVYAPGDDFYFNDTITEPVIITFLEEEQVMDTLNLKFEDFRLPPLSRILNPDEDLTWDWTIGTNKANEQSQMLVMPNYFYMDIGQVDAFYTPVVDLDTVGDPQFIFDYAYSGVAGSPDQLMVVVADPCDVNNPDTLWKGEGLDMATTDVGFDAFEVDNYDEWQSVRLSLKEYVGQRIVLGFISVNQYGNNIFIDNISIMPDSTYQHSITLQVYPDDTVCMDSLVELSVDINGSGDFQTKWYNSTVRSSTIADTFAFPINNLFQDFVVFVTNKYYTEYERVKLEISANPRVGPRLVEQIEDTVVIASRAINADSIVWFGDNGVILRGDTVTYVRQNNESTVRFDAIAYGKCAQATRGITIDFTVNSSHAFYSAAHVYPNPSNTGHLYIEGNGGLLFDSWRLYDLNGLMLRHVPIQERASSFKMDWPLAYGAGVYFVELYDGLELVGRVKVVRVD